jgi:hypothetical protein
MMPDLPGTVQRLLERELPPGEFTQTIDLLFLLLRSFWR